MFFDGVFSMREYTRIFNKNKSKLCVHRYSVGFELTQATNIGCNDLLFLYYSDSSDLPPHTVSAAFFLSSLDAIICSEWKTNLPKTATTSPHFSYRLHKCPSLCTQHRVQLMDPFISNAPFFVCIQYDNRREEGKFKSVRQIVRINVSCHGKNYVLAGPKRNLYLGRSNGCLVFCCPA